MNDRVKKLKDQSLEAVPSISAERAKLLTEFYKENRGKYSVPVERAKAFKHILEYKKVVINDGELIVGERGPAPKATPTYPEICCHSIEDLEILDSREKTPYSVDTDTLETFHDDIIPYWNGRTLREKIFENMSDEWKASFEAGVFTEFMEQRAPGHTVLDDKIYHRGFLDLKRDIALQIKRLDFYNDSEAYDKLEELKGMDIAADAIILFAERHAEEALNCAEKETDMDRRDELLNLAEICMRVPANPPKTFYEALQCYWFVHLGVITEFNTWDSFNPGRLDQHLYPFYKRELEAGILTEEKAKELLQCFWIKFNNQPAPPKVGVTAQESGTYTDFALINTGGLKPDGTDAVNDLTYMILDVILEMRLLQPSSCLQLSRKNPDSFLKKAFEIIKTGFGQPSIFNTDTIIQELTRQGKSVEDARNGGSSGCVEVGAFGKENYCLTGYFNMPKVMEITLNNGVDPRTGKLIGIRTGNVTEFRTFEQLLDAYERQLNHFINIKIRGNSIIEKLYAEYLPSVFMSLIISDCIKNGKDYHSGGARYNTSYIQGVGLGTLTDSFASIKYNVFDRKRHTMREMLDLLIRDFDGEERSRQYFINKTPKYGNDNDYADDIMKQLFEIYFNAIDGRPTWKGGKYRINLLPTTVHVYFGSVIGSTPDGRLSGMPLSEGVSPVQGADTKGPTAVINSVAKMDHIRTGGTLLNQKFTPQLLSDEKGINNIASLVRTYFKMDGHHIQFNVVGADTLRDAQKHPEKYRGLIVRVAGYSDYFNDVGKELQDEIIRRTEHQTF
ncbi:MAG: glycyl radical protein [Acidobacteria bacterium]|nr:glycyl radical protein [Acidobacteriota bacterium]